MYLHKMRSNTLIYAMLEPHLEHDVTIMMSFSVLFLCNDAY